MTVQESNKEPQRENTDGMTPAEASLATSWGIGQTLSSEGSNTNKSIKESTPAIEGYYEIPASLRMRLNDDGSLKQTESKPDDSSVEPELPEVSNDTPSRPKQEANSPFTLDLGSLDDLIESWLIPKCPCIRVKCWSGCSIIFSQLGTDTCSLWFLKRSL